MIMREDIEVYAEVKWGGRNLEEWDMEELARGRPREPDGTFRNTGKTPRWLTPAIAVEARRRLIEKTYGGMAKHLPAAIKVMYELMTSEEIDYNGKPVVDSRTKFAAAAFIIEHFVGKPRMFVELEEKKPEINKAIAAAIVLDDGRPQGHLNDRDKVFEGEVVEDE